MTESYSHLLVRKADLYAALRTLEQDYREGMVDEEAYSIARARYEYEAAEILRRVDALSGGSRDGEQTHTSISSRRPWSLWLPLGAGALSVAVITFFLVTAIHPRSGNQTLTGNDVQPAVVSSVRSSPRLLRAQETARAHPRNPGALIALGNAYLDSGRTTEADRAYQRALRVNPADPDAGTLHAMLLGTIGKDAEALRVIRRVERTQPSYSRAWLVDGLIASHTKRGYTRAVGVWTKFLQLEPHSKVSASVRQMLTRVRSLANAQR